MPVTVTSDRAKPPASAGVVIVSTAVMAFLFGWLAVFTGTWWLLVSLDRGR